MKATVAAIWACQAIFLPSADAQVAIVDCSYITGYSIATGEVFYFAQPAMRPNGFVSKVVGANSKTLTVLSRGGRFDQCGPEYARDDVHVYKRGEVIKGADPASFVFINHYYAKDNHAVYGEHGLLTDRVDTFRVLPSGYATDGVRHYLGAIAIEGDGFVALDWGYSKTNDRVFIRGVPLEGAHAPTFTPIAQSSVWAKDQNRVYYMDRHVVGANPKTIELMSGNGMFARDDRGVYFGEKHVVGANPAAARVLGNSNYVVDDNSVFAGTQQLSRDVTTFKNYGFAWSKDRTAVYFQDVVVPEAEPSSFDATFLGRAADVNFQFHTHGKIECKRRVEAPGQAKPCSR
ncbi:DKNYY domain-containing protein [Variovorax paradoxus]|uniref:DKNYY domain-containing protein n=1 Tax=Variovorax paradoxus TaxID=34073 RepID=UPI003D6510FB